MIVRMAGAAVLKAVRSISVTVCIMKMPTITSAGAVAAGGTARIKGLRNSATSMSAAVVREVAGLQLPGDGGVRLVEFKKAIEHEEAEASNEARQVGCDVSPDGLAAAGRQSAGRRFGISWLPALRAQGEHSQRVSAA